LRTCVDNYENMGKKMENLTAKQIERT
jgi:hypothetical protein